MKCRVSLLLLLWAAGSAHCAEAWAFPFEADKGETRVKTTAEPLPLDKFMFEPPAFAPDRIAAGAAIAEASARKLGSIGARAVVEARIRIVGDYYTHVYLLLVEVTPGRYLPIYGQQYAERLRRPTLSRSSFQADGAALEVRVDYSGTGAFWFADDIAVKFGSDQKPRLSTTRR